MKNQNRRFFSTRDICYIGIFAAIIAVCAQVTVPFIGGVPFTLQTWGVALAGVVLGAKRGVAAVLVYILVGAVGVPVFSGFGGGFGVIFGVTGGFILAFPVLAFAAGISARPGNVFILAAGLVAGTAVFLTLGMLWFAAVTGGTVAAAFAAAVAPFILPEIFKIVAVIIVGKSIQMALVRARIAV